MYESELKQLKKWFPDESFYEILQEEKAIIAGGAITSLFCRREINDIDIYVKDIKSIMRIIRQVYQELNFSVLACNITKKAILLQSSYEPQMKYQLILINGGTPEEIFDKFDFTCCMGAFDLGKQEFVLHKDFLQHNSQRYLKFNDNTLYPLISALRVNKYIEKGYSISKPEFLRIMGRIMMQEINSWEEFIDQTGGMYGLDLEKSLNTQEEFNKEKAFKQLENLFNSDVEYKPRAEMRELEDVLNVLVEQFNLEKVVNAEIKEFKMKEGYFYKSVAFNNGEYISPINRTNPLKYSPGTILNRGEKGIYCFGSNANEESIISKGGFIAELRPLESSQKTGGFETQLMGDVFVTQIINIEEYDPDRAIHIWLDKEE